MPTDRMRRPKFALPCGLTACLCVAACLCVLPISTARSADDWEDKKAERFKPISESQRQQIAAAVPEELAAAPSRPRRVLVFYRCGGFIHGSIPHGNECLRQMATQTDAFEVDFADTYDVFTAENLALYDAIVLNNTTKMQFPSPAHRDAFLDFIADGGGLVGIHAASDNFNRHPECLSLVGGIFNGHPWGAGGRWAFKLNDPKHVLNAAFEGKGFWHTDEIYQYKPESYVGPGVLRVLVSLDMSKQTVSSRIDDGPREVPVSWLRTAGEGRVFYTNFGHREDTFANPMIVKHLLDGIQYALGDLQADATPSSNSEPAEPALAPPR